MNDKTVSAILNEIALDFCNRCCKHEAENTTKGLSMPVCNTCPLRQFLNGEPRADSIRTEDSIFMQFDSISQEACDFYCAFSDDGDCVENCPLTRIK